MKNILLIDKSTIQRRTLKNIGTCSISRKTEKPSRKSVKILY
jgi:hypothetical protein